MQATKINSDLFIGLPVVIKIFPQDSVLWISDFSTNYLVSGVHKESGKVLRQIAQKGNGPLEMTPPVHLFFHNRDFCLYDRNKHRLYQISKDSILINGTLLRENLSFSSSFSLVCHLTDSTGNELYQTGEFPQYWNGEQQFSNREKSMYHQISRQCQHPSLPIFAVSTSDVLTVYRVGSNNLDEIFQLTLHGYSFDYQEDAFVSTAKHSNVPVGIRDIACDNEHIYVLYDPNSETDPHKMSSEVRLYNWEGVLVKTVIPSVNLSIMTLDMAENTIYGISDEDESAIWKVQL